MLAFLFFLFFDHFWRARPIWCYFITARMYDQVVLREVSSKSDMGCFLLTIRLKTLRQSQEELRTPPSPGPNSPRFWSFLLLESWPFRVAWASLFMRLTSLLWMLLSTFCYSSRSVWGYSLYILVLNTPITNPFVKATIVTCSFRSGIWTISSWNLYTYEHRDSPGACCMFIK